MRDNISLQRATLLHPKVKQEVIDTITALERDFPADTFIRIVQGLRTIEEQNALYAKGRTTPGPKVTNARGGSSYHNYGLAIDLAIIDDGKVEWDHPLNARVVAAFKGKGWGWGGDFKSLVDKPHFEKTFGFKPSQLLIKQNNKEFIPGNKYLNI